MVSQGLPQIPGGLQAQIGERGVSLSGQRQRTAIARALVPESSVLILDDSLSSVDARTQNQIAANLRTLSEQGRTTLIVTQRLTLVQDADWIVVLVEQGVHTELLNQPGPTWLVLPAIPPPAGFIQPLECDFKKF